MRYHIDTIPVWDAVKAGKGCPLCYLRQTIEEKDVDRFLGGSVMDPDTRIRVNQKGFCRRHHVMLYAGQNRLGHALMMDSSLIETRARFGRIMEELQQGPKKKRRLRLPGQAAPSDDQDRFAELRALSSSCILCDSIEENLRRYRYTIAYLYKTDTTFRQAFPNCGFCLDCMAPLLEMAAEELNGEDLNRMIADLRAGTDRLLEQEEINLKNFTLLFDYRNAGKTIEGTKGALEKAVNTMRGRCLAEPD